MKLQVFDACNTFGRVGFYPYGDLSKDFLKIFNRLQPQKKFTLKQLICLIKLGFEVHVHPNYEYTTDLIKTLANEEGNCNG